MSDITENSNLDENFKEQVNKSKDKKFTIFNIVLIFAIFAGLLSYMIIVDGIDNIVNVLNSVNYYWVLAGLVCMVLSWISEAMCLHIPIVKLYPNQKFSNSLKIMMIGQLFNNITPFCSGGQPMQAYYMYKDGKGITYMVYRAFGNSGVSLFTIVPAQAFLLMLMTFIPTPGSGGGAEGGFLLIFNTIFR